MSQWTHVAAIIRYDGLRLPGVDDECHPAGFLGQQYHPYEEHAGEHDIKPELPCGSEGSLRWEVHVNPSEGAMAAYVAYIYGDLRDYNSFEEIEAYFSRISVGKFIRQGSATVEVEGVGTRHYDISRDGCRMVADMGRDGGG